jgi:hypothetical protein
MAENEQPATESVATELPTELDKFDHATLKKVSEDLLEADAQVKAWTEKKTRAEGAFDLMRSMLFEKYNMGAKDKIEVDGKIIRNP